MSETKILSCGEVLWDLFPEGARFGGAPANFACHAALLGGEVSILSAVGKDQRGDEALTILQGFGVDTSLIQPTSAAPTGSVGVSVDAAGKPSFEIHVGSAWDRVDWTDTLAARLSTVDALYFGTLGQRGQPARATIRRAAGLAQTRNILRVLDVNLRRPFYDAALIRESVALASVLKLSDEELPEVAVACGVAADAKPESTLRSLLKRSDLDLVVMTRGAEGAILVSAEDTIVQPGFPTVVRDTVGAGGRLHGRVHRRTPAAHARCSHTSPRLPGRCRRLCPCWGRAPSTHLMNRLSHLVSAFSLLSAMVVTLFAAEPRPESDLVALEKILGGDGGHLIVPVGNYQKPANTKVDPHLIALGIYDGDTLVQSFDVALPRGNDPFWLAAYPLESFGLKGKKIRLATTAGAKAPESCRAAFERIKIGSAADALSATDYTQPYRNQFHASTRRGWVNDPNGMVFHDGKYHLYYQHNPFGIFWGNMHWGHFESTDLIHWEEKPIALFQRTPKDMAYSGGGFVDFNNSAGLGKNTLFIAFTSTGRGECLAYSKDGGLTFTELPENPVLRHEGRDPKIIWYEPEQKWVMVVYGSTPVAETEAIPQASGPKERASAHIAFLESKNLRQWQRTGAFTDPDRKAVYECPELFELPVAGKSGESRWILLGAQNRYFLGRFDGKTFQKESGPHGTRHGAFYAAQTFSDVPDGRRIQIGWVRTEAYLQRFPDQIVNQAFTLPHELTLRPTGDGLRVGFSPVKETERLRGEVLAEGKDLTPAQANELLQRCRGELSETLIEFSEATPRQLVINGIDASFEGRTVRIFTDRTFNEVYADDGLSYELRTRSPNAFDSTETRLTATEGSIRSLKIFRLKSIWVPR